jgi:hypothetical protein
MMPMASRRKKVERPTLNALGKPISPLYDPDWKRKTLLTSIDRLRAPRQPPIWDARGEELVTGKTRRIASHRRAR